MRNPLRLLLGAVAVQTTQSDIRGISYFGFETEHATLTCDWKHDIAWNVHKIATLGFNSIRLPFSYDYVIRGDWTQMDVFFSEVSRYNVSVVLDFHRNDNTHQSAKPYTDEVSFDQFLGAWKTILLRYRENKRLVACDLFNKYQSDNYVEWNSLARQIVAYIEAHFPERFSYFVGGVRWGGDIHYVSLEDLPYNERIFYTVHKYWFSDQEPLEENWAWSFDISHKLRVIVGEWGYISTDQSQVEWAHRFVSWLKSKNVTNSFFWVYSPNSDDTGGILLNDCETVDTTKMELLYDYWGYHPPKGRTGNLRAL